MALIGRAKLAYLALIVPSILTMLVIVVVAMVSVALTKLVMVFVWVFTRIVEACESHREAK
jgi:hypothetical protein